MPKDEFDPEDPMELSGVCLLTEEDTTEPMAECFIEEFLRMGYNPKQVLALFRNPYYMGMNMVLQNRGEACVRKLIETVFARWGRPFRWPAAAAALGGMAPEPGTATPAGQSVELDLAASDPTGAAVPKINL